MKNASQPRDRRNIATLSHRIARAAKRWGNERNYVGMTGGWVYKRRPQPLPGLYQPACQGWWTFAQRKRWRIALDIRDGTFKVRDADVAAWFREGP